MDRNIYTRFSFVLDKLKNNFLFPVLLSLISIPAFAQQEPGYSQFMYNKLPINPAYAGGRNMLSVRMLYRDQWTQLEGHPRTMSFSIHSPIANDNIGIGGGIIYDQVGVSQKTRIHTAYAYRIKLNPSGKQNMQLSMGINVGLYFYKADLSKVNPVENNDPTFSQDISKIMPDLGAGVYFSGSNFYVGLSVPNFLTLSLGDDQNLSSGITENSKRVSHLFAMAGGVLPISRSKNIQLRPQIMIREIVSKIYHVPISLDANISLLMYDKVNVGITYRSSIGNKNLSDEGSSGNKESMDFILELWPIRSLMIGYSYDYTLSALKNDQKGTHELILGYDLKPRKKKGTAIGCYHF